MSRTPIIRTSERRDLGRCIQRWWWAWREGLREKGSPAPPLWFGIGIHISLALWYCGPGTKRGPHPAETWDEYCGAELAWIKTADLTDEKLAKYVGARELGIAMMNGYVEKYGRDEQKLIIAPEQTFSLDIPWHDRQQLFDYVEGTILARYVGTFDGVWRHADTGGLWLDEHKTAKAIVTSHLPMDTQGGSYWAVAARTLEKQKLIKPGEQLKGIQYNFLRKGVPDDRPRDAEGYYCNKPLKADYVLALDGKASQSLAQLAKLNLGQLEVECQVNGLTVLGERSKVQPAPLFVREDVYRTRPERAAQLRRIQDEAVVMQAYRQGLLPLTKNPTRDCSWDCRFYTMCQLQEGGGNWEDFRDLQFVVADPYADHRKSTDE